MPEARCAGELAKTKPPSQFEPSLYLILIDVPPVAACSCSCAGVADRLLLALHVGLCLNHEAFRTCRIVFRACRLHMHIATNASTCSGRAKAHENTTLSEGNICTHTI